MAVKTCEQMEAEIAAGKNPYADLIILSKGNDWKVQMGVGGNDAVSAKEAVERSNGDNGVPWIDGRAGGQGQAPIAMTGDAGQGRLQRSAESAHFIYGTGTCYRRQPAGGPVDHARFGGCLG